MKNNSQECCPRFEPINWDDKILEWQEKQFIKGRVLTLFFIPMNFGSVMRRLDKIVREAGAKIQDNMGLADHTSKWNMDLYLAVDGEIPGAENTTLTGKFFSKVYEGDFKDTGRWHKDYEALAKNKGISIDKTYMWYTTCPKCAKKYGQNYTVIIGKISPSA